MNKVYCLKQDLYWQENGDVVAVFSSKELATEYAKTLPSSYFDEYKFDPEPDPLILDLVSTKEDLWKVRMHWDGNLDSIIKITHDIGKHTKYGYETLWVYPHDHDDEIPDFFVIVRAKNRKDAKSLADEYRLRHLEERSEEGEKID